MTPPSLKFPYPHFDKDSSLLFWQFYVHFGFLCINIKCWYNIIHYFVLIYYKLNVIEPHLRTLLFQIVKCSLKIWVLYNSEQIFSQFRAHFFVNLSAWKYRNWHIPFFCNPCLIVYIFKQMYPWIANGMGIMLILTICWLYKKCIQIAWT